MSNKYDYLIVGSGLFGATFAYCATKTGKRCLVIDKRPYAGGNVHCERKHGIDVHLHGPHIFHTKNDRVWNFVNNFVHFNRFTLQTVANNKGELYNLPFNLNTFHQLWGVNTPEQARLEIERQRRHGSVSNLEEQALALVGHDVFETLIRGYTEKQWGRACNVLPSDIIQRLPVRYTYDNNYFDDPYQGIPIEGYNQLIDSLLEGTELWLETDFFDSLHRNWKQLANYLVYTGQLDAYFQYRLGALNYRSLRLETEVLDMPNFQGVALMNFTDSETPFTRITEHKHFTCFAQHVYDIPKTVITREYPVEYVPSRGKDIAVHRHISTEDDSIGPCYPINDTRNSILAARYKMLAKQEADVAFGGRLAQYRYCNMDETIAEALALWMRLNSCDVADSSGGSIYTVRRLANDTRHRHNKCLNLASAPGALFLVRAGRTSSHPRGRTGIHLCGRVLARHHRGALSLTLCRAGAGRGSSRCG